MTTLLTNPPFTFALIPFVVSTLLCLGMALYAFTRGTLWGARSFGWMCLAQATWASFYLFELVAPTLPEKLFWDSLQWASMIFTVFMILNFALMIANRTWRVLPVVMWGSVSAFMIIIFYPPTSAWVYPDPTLIVMPPFNVLHYTFSPLNSLVTLFTYIIILVAFALIVYVIWTRPAQRRSLSFMAVGVLVMIFLSLITDLLNLTVFGQRDISPIAILIGNLLVVTGLFWQRPFDVAPIARGQLLENLDEAVIVIDRDNRIIDINYNARHAPSMVLKEPIGRLIHEAYPLWQDIIQKLHGQHRAFHEVSISRANSLHFYELRIEPIMDGHGHLVGRLLLNRDVTQRRRTEEALRRSEEELRGIASHIAEMVVRLDPQGKITYISPGCERILERLPGDLIGQPALRFIHLDDHQVAAKGFRDFLRGDSSGLIEFRCVTVDGIALWGESSGNVVHDEQGNVTGVIAVFRNIQQRKQLEHLQLESARLHAALQKEQELHDLKTRMMIRIAHEFRTPLAVIQNASDLIARYNDRMTPIQRQQRTDAINEQVRHVVTMLDSMALLLNGSLMPEKLWKAPVDIGLLCDEIVHRHSETTQRQIVYIIDADDTTLHADHAILTTAITHVLKNAIQFSPDHSTVRFEVHSQNDDVVIRVHDEGVGVLPEEQERVFEPFFRGSNLDEISGLGLGLTIARAAIAAHHGTISLASTVLGGTVVHITLPRRVPTPQEIPSLIAR